MPCLLVFEAFLAIFQGFPRFSGLSLKNYDWGLTDIHTEDRKRGNPVETEIPRRARYWLVDITGL